MPGGVASRAGALLALGLCLWAPAALAAGPPQIGPTWTAGVGTTGAGLRAEVNPEGLATTYRFHYISQSAYEANLSQGKDGFEGAAKAPAAAPASLGSGASFLLAAQTIGSLAPDTDYRYRVQATNSAGAVSGPTMALRTEAFATASPLLDRRAWELVSPAEKGGAEIQGPGESFGGGHFQAAVAGGAITFSSLSSFGPAGGAPPVSQYVSRRTAGGWATENLSAATAAGAYGPDPDGAPYRLFAPDLSRAAMSEGERYSLRDRSGGLLALGPADPGLRFAGASADLAHVVLADANLYRWSGGGLVAINVLPGGTLPTPGAVLAAPAGAVSTDANRIYWALAGDLYLREGAATKQVDASLGGGGTFEAASADGAVAFFTKAGHLYRYETLSDTSTDLTPAGEVLGVLGASASGSHVYYLTSSGLFLRSGAVTTKVAEGADVSNYPPASGTARVTPSGDYLAFLSAQSLTGHDTRHAATGVPQTQVYLYETGADTLTCASCNPTGERPAGPSNIPGALRNGTTQIHKPRNLSDDGRRLFFDSADSLAIADTAGQPDVYEWEANGTGTCERSGGCLALISRGRNSAGASFLDASANGSDAFFLTADSLVAADTGLQDVYVAREGGGFPEPVRPIECVGDSCQPLPSAPEDPQPGTLVPSTGNPPLRLEAAKGCRRGFVRRRGRCVRRGARQGKAKRAKSGKAGQGRGRARR